MRYSANGTDRKDGGNPEQGSDVQGNWFFSCVFVSTANNKVQQYVSRLHLNLPCKYNVYIKLHLAA